MRVVVMAMMAMACGGVASSPAFLVGASGSDLFGANRSPAPSVQSSIVLTPPLSGSYPSVICGRGDKRTAKGKRFRHSFGNCRPRKPNKGRGLPPTPLPAKPPAPGTADSQDPVSIKME